MIAAPPGVRVYLACGTTDMRRGMAGLAMQVRQVLERNPLICVGQEYVAASPKDTLFHVDSQSRRHIRSHCRSFVTRASRAIIIARRAIGMPAATMSYIANT